MICVWHTFCSELYWSLKVQRSVTYASQYVHFLLFMLVGLLDFTLFLTAVYLSTQRLNKEVSPLFLKHILISESWKFNDKNVLCRKTTHECYHNKANFGDEFRYIINNFTLRKRNPLTQMALGNAEKNTQWTSRLVISISNITSGIDKKASLILESTLLDKVAFHFLKII